ncbi:MAG: F0F1 ATP synthase subunit epsilon [Planctomycetes bacterium]|nr:F0F1 ATP synthase subunit epsilon [Planctomycetota bacterium]
MVRISSGFFRCVLLTPTGKVLDCRTSGLVLPVHDGLMGVLRNHSPMLCKLGKGILQVRDIPEKGDAFYLIDGGFARISENFVTVLTYEVVTFEGMDRETAEHLVSRAKSVVVGGDYIRQTEKMASDKAALLVKMGEMTGIIRKD